MGKIGFKFTYHASAKPEVPLFGNKDTTVADSSDGDSNRLEEKSSIRKNVRNDDLWEILDEGELFDKFDS